VKFAVRFTWSSHTADGELTLKVNAKSKMEALTGAISQLPEELVVLANTLKVYEVIERD